LDLDLRAVLLVLRVNAPELVTLSDLPVVFAVGEMGAVGPDHVRRGPAGVAKPAGEERLTGRGAARLPLGQEGEAIGELPRLERGQGHDRRFRAGHRHILSSPPAAAGRWTLQ